ncbi:MAG: ECF-type sigma factor [Myxococcota bacterium]
MSSAAVTLLLKQWRAGDERALEPLISEVYVELKAIARRNIVHEHGAEIETTELVNMAYERLIQADVDYVDRAHFFAIAARTMRRVLIDQARQRGTQKRGGGAEFVTLTNVADPEVPLHVDLLDLDAALNHFADRYERHARVVECFYFGGLTQDEIAAALDVSVNTVGRDLRFARAWLTRALRDSVSGAP